MGGWLGWVRLGSRWGTANAVFEKSNDFGDLLSACGQLRGLGGVILKVKTIWIRLSAVNETRFVTLVPDEERYPHDD